VIVRTVALTALLAVGATTAHAQGKTRTVGVVSDYFDPDALTVDVGDKVKWVWKGTSLQGHDVNVDAGPERFSSETQFSGSFSHTFKKAGTYKLYCTQHDGMTQTVKVRRAKRQRSG
jgi:plastocyanin